MNIRLVKLDLTETNEQLRRIANLLEGILGATNQLPLQMSDFPEEEAKERLFYTSNDEEIIAHKLKLLGKEYKPSTPKR